MNITSLANEYKSDKGTIFGNPPHRYSYLYDLLFYEFRARSINLLEMGLAVGGPEVGGPIDRLVSSPSVNIWLRFFSDAKIYGFDISDFSHMKHDRFKFIRGDSGSNQDLERLVSIVPDLDIVIDDASHASFHQQLPFKHLWGKVKSGGLYIVEDLQWQSPAFEGSLPPTPKTSDLFCNFFEKGEFLEGPVLTRDFMEQIKRESFSFSAFHSFDRFESPVKQIVIRKA